MRARTLEAFEPVLASVPSELDEVGLHAGERVTVEPAGDGELRIRRTTTTFDDAFGTLTGTYPAGYLEQLDAEDQLR